MSFGDRVSGAIRLRSAVFEDVELDASSLKQAVTVVILSATCMALGTHGSENFPLLVTAIAAAILGWVVWAWIALLVGTSLLKETQTEADLGQLLRTTGFATAPGLLAIAGIVRPFAGFAVFVAFLWILAAYVVAVRQALDYHSTLRAVVVCLAGWLVYAAMLLLLVSTPPY